MCTTEYSTVQYHLHMPHSSNRLFRDHRLTNTNKVQEAYKHISHYYIGHPHYLPPAWLAVAPRFLMYVQEEDDTISARIRPSVLCPVLLPLSLSCPRSPRREQTKTCTPLALARVVLEGLDDLATLLVGR